MITDERISASMVEVEMEGMNAQQPSTKTSAHEPAIWEPRAPRRKVSWPMYPPGLVHRGTNTSPGLAARPKLIHRNQKSRSKSEPSPSLPNFELIDKPRVVYDEFALPEVWGKGVGAVVSYERSTRDRERGTQTEGVEVEGGDA